MSDIAIVSGGWTRCGAEWTSGAWIDEPCLKLYVIGAGSGRYAIPGHELGLCPGRFYLIPGGRRHRFGSAAGLEVHWLHLRPLSPALAQRLARLARISEWPVADWAWWRPTWSAIPDAVARGGLRDVLAVRAFALAALAAALGPEDAGERVDARLLAAQAWMDEHCLEHPALPAVARIAGLAPAVFHRRFTAAYARTPRAWLEDRRLDHARQLLREPGARVAAVAAACGYANPFHFSRVVRRRLGTSPSRLAAMPGP